IDPNGKQADKTSSKTDKIIQKAWDLINTFTDKDGDLINLQNQQEGKSVSNREFQQQKMDRFSNGMSLAKEAIPDAVGFSAGGSIGLYSGYSSSFQLVYVFNDDDKFDIPSGFYLLWNHTKTVSDGFDISLSAGPSILYSLNNIDEPVGTLDGPYLYGGAGGGDGVTVEVNGTVGFKSDSKKPTWLNLGFEVGFGSEASPTSGANLKGGVGYTTIIVQ